MPIDQQPHPPGQAHTGPDDSRIRGRDTDATRYLCAAAYLDEPFARLVLDEVLHQPHRAVAPSYGIDLGPIIRHCLEARRLRLSRDLVVTVALAAVVILAVANGVTVVLGLIALWLGVQGLRLLTKRVVNAGLAMMAVAAVFYFIAFRGASAYVGTLGYEQYPVNEETDGGRTWGIPLLCLGAVLVIWAAYFWHRISVHRTIATKLTPDSFDGARAPAAGLTHEFRLAYIEHAQGGNVTVYSQDWAVRPFVGSGAVTTEWNLVTPLRPAEVDLERRASSDATVARSHARDPVAAAPLDARTLYERTREGLVALARPSLSPHERLHQLSVQDRVFIAGLLPIDSPVLDAHRRPIFRMDDDKVGVVDRAERGQVRHYQTVRMAAWHGELEVTTFLYISVRGGMLYVEFVATKLPSIRAEYHKIDSYERLDPSAATVAGARALADVIGCLLAPLNVGIRASEAIRRAFDPAADTREIDRRLAFDYGARSSVREIGAHFSRSVRFQDYDANERVSLVERRLLEIVVDTMREYGYDVSDLVGQATTVINNSTQVGSVQGTGIAIGAGASSTATQRTPTARRVKEVS